MYSAEDMLLFGTVLLKNEGDCKTVYAFSNGAPYAKIADLMKVVLEQKTMEFRLITDVVDEPNWDKADDPNRGENQVDSMGDDTIIAKFTPDRYTRTYNSEVEFAEYESVLKKRMDILGVDYMFGTAGYDDKTYCIRIDPKTISPDFFRLIFFARSGNIKAAFDDIYSFSSPEVVEKDGKLAIRTTTYSTAEELLAEYDIPGNTLYLIINDVTVASADISQIQPLEGNKNYLDFENFLCFNESEATAEERNILDLMCAIQKESYVPFDGTFSFVKMDSKGKVTDCILNDCEWKYNSFTAEDDRVFEIIEGMGCTVSKMVDARNMIYITLDIDVNEELPVNFVNKMKEVYTACNFDSGAYNEIHFVIKNEKNESPANAFNFKITKDSYDQKMQINDYVSGPKFSDYWTEVYDMTKSDPFFTERSY